MRWIVVAVLAWTWTPAGPARAAQEDLTLAELEARAERIVVAEVTSVETRWAGNDRGDLETVAWLSVEQTLAGEPAAAVAVVLGGGHRGDIGTWIPDEPVLVADRRYRLLLARDELDRWRVLGGHAGAEPLEPLPCYGLNGVDWSYHAHPVEEDFVLNVQSFPDGLASDDVTDLGPGERWEFTAKIGRFFNEAITFKVDSLTGTP